MVRKKVESFHICFWFAARKLSPGAGGYEEHEPTRIRRPPEKVNVFIIIVFVFMRKCWFVGILNLKGLPFSFKGKVVAFREELRYTEE